MRFEHLEYLLEIDRCHSLSKAAKNLYVTQPTLSAAVNSLEVELGFPIFTRSNTGMHPTNNGEQVIRDAQTIISIYRKWLTFPTSGQAQIEGTIQVAATPSICKSFMFYIIGELHKLAPMLNVTLREVWVKDIMAHMKNHQSSLSVIGYPRALIGTLEGELSACGYQLQRLHSETMRCIISTKHPLSQKESLSLDDLKQLSFALYPDNGDPITTRIQSILPQDCPRFYTDNDNLICDMVSANMAACIGPEMSALSTQFGNSALFRFLPVEGFSDICDYLLIHPKAEHMSAAERKFVETAAAVFTSFQDCI